MLYLPLSPRLGVRELGFWAGLVDMPSELGSGVDEISACGMDAEISCSGRIQDSVAEAEAVDEPDEVVGAEASGDESLFSIFLIL